MRRRIRSLILTVGLLLTLTPDTAMAAKMEKDVTAVQESEKPQNAAETGETGVMAVEIPLNMEGSGTVADPYRIKDAEQLCLFTDMVNGAGSAPNVGLCAVLTQDIDLSGVCGAEIGSWTPIGTDKNPYTGTFDGGSFVVSGLYYHKSDVSYAGLFGGNAGTIKNLGVAGADIAAGSYVGSVCGFNRGTITGCYNTGAVKGGRYTGGICGYNDGGGTVRICYNTGAVSGSKYVGGICGYNKNETSGSYNMGTVNGSGTSVGGICGYNRKLVSGCYNTGEVGGRKYVGSVCGYNHSESTFVNCYYLVIGTEKGNYGVAMTQQQFASGEVCWLLNEGKSENVIWHQTCGAGFPAFGGKTVYQMQTYKQSGNTKEVVVAYTNDKNKRGMVSQTAPANSDNNSGETADGNTGGHVYQEPEWKWKEYKSAKAVFTCQDCGEQLILEASISKKKKAATCAAEGETAYTATVERDGETYKDKKTVKSEKLAHQPLEPKAVEAATCEKAGISRPCWTCPACGKFFEDEQGTKELSRNEVVIKALGHKFVPNYPWDWDMGNNPPLATLTFNCSNGCGKTERKEGKVTAETNATCTAAGETTYTAVVILNDRRYENQRYEDQRTVSGQPMPHSYGEPVWAWSSDCQSATATFTCTKCGNVETKDARITSETKDSTCTAAGEITYTAVVELGGKEYPRVKKQPLAKAEHSYREPVWTWSSDCQSATAKFICANCGTSTSPVKATVTHSKTAGKDCKAPGKIIHTASVTFDGKTYPDTREEEIPAEHTLTHVEAKAATCETPGNEEYWQCSVCSKLFSDAEGTAEITSSTVISATRHDFEPVPDDPELYMCTVCKKKFRVTEEKDGTISIYSVEDDTAIPQNEKESDNNVSPSVPDGKEQNGAESDEGKTLLPPESEETQEDSVPETADEQDGQENRNKEGSQNEPDGQNVEGSKNGQDGGNVEGSRAEQNEQAEEGNQNEQEENLDGIIDTQDNAARYGIIYPEGEETENDTVTDGELEGNAVSLRAESSANGAVQTTSGQQGHPLWVSAAVLAILAGAVLILVLQRNRN